MPIKPHLISNTIPNVNLCKARPNLSIPLLVICLFASTFNLSACATKIGSKSNPPLTNVSSKKPTINTPENGLSAEFVYKYLVGEVAGQRGDFATSSAVFYDLAMSERNASLAERAARVAIYGNVANLTIPTIKLWAELDPTSNEAQQAMTEMLIASGKFSESQPYLTKLLSKEPTRATGFLYINALLSRSADKAGVLRLIQSLAKPYPKLPEAQFAIAQSAWAAKQYEVALKALDRTETLKPGWNVAAILKGQLLFDQSPQAAIDFYKTYLGKYPDANEVRLNLAKVLVSEKQYDEAKLEYPIIIQMAKDSASKNDAEITVVIGLLSAQSNDYVAAENYFQEALKLDYKDAEQIYIYLAQAAEKQHQDDAASSWYSKVKAGSHYLEAQIELANVIARTQSTDKAIEKLDAIDDITTEQQIIVIQSQAGLLAKAKRNQESFDLLEKTVKNMPNTPELIYDYALAAERIQKFDLMEAELRKTIAAKPDFAAAYNALGYSFADRNIRLDEALQLIEKALEILPNDHFMLDSLGWVHYRKGNLNKAIGYLQQAYKSSQDPEIAAHLGEVLWKKGRKEEAEKIWNEALIVNPDNEVLHNTTQKFGS